jgi:hypothetical protein
MGKQKHLQKKKRREALRRLFPPMAQGASVLKQRRAVSPPLAVVGLPICYSDLMDRVPTEDEIDAQVALFVRAPTFFMLAMLNTLISFYEHDRQEFTYVQGFLFSNLADDELFERTKQRFPHEQRALRPMFHRQQMLVLIKKVLLLAGDEDQYNPNDITAKDAKYALGKLALMTSDLLNPENQALKLGPHEHDEHRRRDEFCTQMIPISSCQTLQTC